LTGMVTSVPPYETFSLIKNIILHQSINYVMPGIHWKFKGEFAVVATDKICLSSKIPVDIKSIFMKLCHVTNVT
jgi:hypothetical protein